MPSRVERIEHDGRAFAIFVGERRCRIQHRDLGAEPAKCLRQFEALRAGADDDEMARTFGQIEHRLGGQVRRIERGPEIARHDRRGAGGDDEAPRLDGRRRRRRQCSHR